MNHALTNAMADAETFERLAVNLEQRGCYALAHWHRRYARRCAQVAERLREQLSSLPARREPGASSVVAPVALDSSGATGLGDDTDPPCGSFCMAATFIQP